MPVDPLHRTSSRPPGRAGRSKALRHEAADRPTFWRKCVLHNLCSRCRGTKAAFGDEVVAKSDNALCQLNQALRVCDCCVAVAHQTDRSLRSSAAATETASSLFSGFFVQVCQLLRDGCGPLDRVCLTDTLSTYPAFVSNRDMGFALTASHFAKAAK